MILKQIVDCVNITNKALIFMSGTNQDRELRSWFVVTTGN